MSTNLPAGKAGDTNNTNKHDTTLVHQTKNRCEQLFFA